jgi:hypothetical protein
LSSLKERFYFRYGRREIGIGSVNLFTVAEIADCVKQPSRANESSDRGL